MTNPRGQVVLVTGCSSGIGLAVARAFAARGAHVFASMRGAETRGAALREEAARAGWRLETPDLDVTSDASVDAAVRTILGATAGRLDVLVNNAGYYCYGPWEELHPDELTAQLATNVVGVHRVTRAVLPTMRAQRTGAIVTIGSLAGLSAIPVTGAYHASKWALEAMVESLRYEVAPFGIRVTLIEPGPFRTELHNKEVRAAASARTDSPYAPLLERYEAIAAKQPRADTDRLVRTILRAALARNPRLRWPVGPLSFVTPRLRPLTWDRLYGWIVGLVFGWRRTTGR